MSEFSIDAKSLKMGEMAVDGGMSTTLTTIGEIKENTLKVIEADTVVTSIRALGKRLPVININQDGDINVEFDVMTKDKEVMADLMGGTVTGEEGAEKWNRPVRKPIIEKSIEVEDGDGDKMQLPRVSIVGTIQGVYSPTDVNVIRVKGMVMQPTKAGVSAVIW